MVFGLTLLILALSVDSAQAEPISTAIGLTALLAPVFGTFAGAIGGFFVTVGASIGVSELTKTMQGGKAPDQPTQANAPEIRFNERQAIPSKRILYGTCYVGGSLFFEYVKPPYLYQGVLISARKVNAFKKIWIGNNEVALPAYRPNSILVPNTSAVADRGFAGGVRFVDNLQISVRLGEQSQAMDPILAADFTHLGSEFRQRGIATAVLRYNYGTDANNHVTLWGQTDRPGPFFLVEGVSVPDPRNPTHTLDWDINDPVSVAAAEATWSFSNNAALCQTHYLTQRYGGRIPPQKINWDKVAEAADYDDEVFYCNNGTFIKKHTLDGVVTLNQRPVDVIGAMLSANRGFVLESRGRIWVSSSKPKDAILTINDKLIVGGFQFRGARPKRDLINTIRTRFISSERDYQEADGPVITSAAYKLVDDELLEATLNLPFTLDHRRVQRLSKITLEGSRLGKTISCVVDVRALALASDDLIGAVVNFDSQLFTYANGTYMVLSVRFSPQFSALELLLIEYSKSVENSYVAASDEQTFTLPALDLT